MTLETWLPHSRQIINHQRLQSWNNVMYEIWFNKQTWGGLGMQILRRASCTVRNLSLAIWIRCGLCAAISYPEITLKNTHWKTYYSYYFFKPKWKIRWVVSLQFPKEYAKACNNCCIICVKLLFQKAKKGSTSKLFISKLLDIFYHC